LYPTVPCYRLPAVHNWLKQERFFERHGSYIEPGAIAALKYTGSRYRYPCEPIAPMPSLPALPAVLIQREGTGH
jgi:hypothetical protein